MTDEAMRDLSELDKIKGTGELGINEIWDNHLQRRGASIVSRTCLTVVGVSIAFGTGAIVIHTTVYHKTENPIQ